MTKGEEKVKQLTCEMCGGTELIKKDGVFVCQTCGTKYSIEDAKKMMIEGTVDVSGSTIKVDNTASIENFYKMAESAREAANNKEAEDYCNRILEIDSKNAKAWLLKGIVAGWQSSLANIRMDEFYSCVQRALESAKTLDELDLLADEASLECRGLLLALNKNRLDVIKEYEDVVAYNREKLEWLSSWFSIQIAYENRCKEIKKDERGEIREVCSIEALDSLTEGWNKDVIESANNKWNGVNKRFFELAHKYHDTGTPEYAFEDVHKTAWVAVCLLKYILIVDVNKIAELDEEKKASNIRVAKTIINILDKVRGFAHNTNSRDKVYHEVLQECHETIKLCDQSYVIPEIREERSSPSGGCYVATAVYGSYDCPEVWTLRRYRDYSLAKTWYGRAFIYTYYAISPMLVKWFGETKWFKSMWKGKLDRMVKELQDKGFESTPYEDHDWK